MTTEPTTPQGDTPLWTNERINECIRDALSQQPGHTPRGLVRRVSYAVRDDYESARAADRQRIEQMEGVLEYYMQTAEVTDETMTDQRRTIAKLEAEIVELKELIEEYKVVRENAMVEIAQLRAQADPDALTAAYMKGRSDALAPGVQIPDRVYRVIVRALKSQRGRLNAELNGEAYLDDHDAALAWISGLSPQG